MKFYLITATFTGSAEKAPQGDGEENREQLCYSDGNNGRAFVSEIEDGQVSIAVVHKDFNFNPTEFPIPWDKIAVIPNEITYNEITSAEFAQYLSMAEGNRYLLRPRSLLQRFHLKRLLSPDGLLAENRGYRETCIPENSTREEIEAELEKALWKRSFKDELDRIYTAPMKEGYFGHPVHYVLMGDNYENRNIATSALIRALYGVKRIRSRRYCEISLSNFNMGDLQCLERLYDCYAGGTIVIKYRADACREGGVEDVAFEAIDAFCEQILAHNRDVLTIFCFPRFCRKENETFIERFPNLSFIEIEEGSVSREEARGYVIAKAKESEFEASESLLSKLSEDKEYSLKEIDDIYAKWEANYVKTDIFPQYSQVSSVRANVVSEKPKSDAYDELQAMVGLAEVKKMIDSIIDYAKMQKLFREQKHFSSRPALHMCFTGNPGSAKTTVARLLAQILRDHKVLANGHIIECGRADLVGKYVGYTAPIIKHRFIQARGGILFIDEAYSLVDDKDGMYGDEAINTIVQEMENSRNDVIVVFAGYPDKMEGFLNKNPGLRSRIAFHVPFADYNAEELYAITELLAKKSELTLSGNVKSKLIPLYERACQSNDFGNGRFARTMLEKATMRQASRLVAGDIDFLSSADLAVLYADDFVLEENAISAKAHRRIGF